MFNLNKKIAFLTVLITLVLNSGKVLSSEASVVNLFKGSTFSVSIQKPDGQVIELNKILAHDPFKKFIIQADDVKRYGDNLSLLITNVSGPYSDSNKYLIQKKLPLAFSTSYIIAEEEEKNKQPDVSGRANIFKIVPREDVSLITNNSKEGKFGIYFGKRGGQEITKELFVIDPGKVLILNATMVKKIAKENNLEERNINIYFGYQGSQPNSNIGSLTNKPFNNSTSYTITDVPNAPFKFNVAERK